MVEFRPDRYFDHRRIADHRRIEDHRPIDGTASATTYHLTVWAERRNDPCSGHAYGAGVNAFISQHRCTLSHRLLVTTVVNGHPVAASLQQLNVPGTLTSPYPPAGEFATLLTAQNTGSTNDLFREGYRIPDMPAAIPPTEDFEVEGGLDGFG